MKIPNVIVHMNYHKDDDFVSLSTQCCSVMHFSKGESRLLRYYATVSSGFKPAASVICKEVGLTERHLYRARKRLETCGVLYRKERTLYVCWDRIKLYASLDPSMTKTKNGFFSQAGSLSETSVQNLGAKALYLRSAPIDDVISWLTVMSEKEYEAISHRIHREEQYYNELYGNNLETEDDSDEFDAETQEMCMNC